MSYYNNYAPCDDTHQQQRQQYTSRGHYSEHQQQFTNSNGGGPPTQSLNSQQQQPQQQQYYYGTEGQGHIQAQQYAAWNYHQQNLMRYPVQPPTYPPPAFAYQSSYLGYPNYFPAVPPRGFACPQPPTPAAVSAYQNSMVQGRQRNTSPMHPQQLPPPSSPIIDEIPKPDIKEEPSLPTDVKDVKAKPIVIVGKRRGGRVLPTGVVKKQRTENVDQGRKDPWSQYMHEVRRYKEQSCEDDRKNRPLVK